MAFLFPSFEATLNSRINIMPVDKETYKKISTALALKHVDLVAVSKTKSVADIFELYQLGQRDFGENYVQELAEKHLLLPHDIRWHFIGHLQSNKVKYIAPFVHLIQGVDSFKLLREINRQAEKNHRTIQCLLQAHIAQEETKFGLNEAELDELFADLAKTAATGELKFIKIVGLMGMASFTENINKVKLEFKYLKFLFDKFSDLSMANLPAYARETSAEQVGQGGCQLSTLSMGMSSHYKVAQ